MLRHKLIRFFSIVNPSFCVVPAQPSTPPPEKTVQSVRLLAERGCDLSKRDSQSVTPAFFAAQEGHAECLALLLSLGADGSVARADGATPLIIAAQNGHDSCVAILLNPPPIVFTSPVTPNSATGGRATTAAAAALSAAGSAHAPAADSVVPSAARRAGLEHRTSSGYTALTLAVVAKQPRCAELLLAAGAEVDAADRKGRSPLYLAAAVGDSIMCGLLLGRGAQPRRKTVDGVEPAIAAAARGHASATRRIVEDAGLDPATVADAAGVPLSSYLADFKFGKNGSGSSRSNGRGDGGKRVAALLPASVARLPPAATGAAVKQQRNRHATTTTTTTPTIRSKISTHEAKASIPPRHPSTGAAPPPRPAPVRPTFPRRTKTPPPPRRPHRTTTVPAAGRSNRSASPRAEARVSSPQKNKMLHRTWSGVHGGEDGAATAGIKTPGRRTPVRVGKGVGSRVREAAVRPAAAPPEEERGVRGGHDTLLERMTAFLFDVEGDKKKRVSSKE